MRKPAGRGYNRGMRNKPELAEDIGKSMAEDEPVADVSWIEDFPARKYGIPRIGDRPFREVFAESAMLFMDERQIARMLGITVEDLDERCRVAFGTGNGGAKSMCAQFAAAADQDARMLMRELSERGNSTATGIYANYIARLARDADAASGGIKVVVNLPKED